MTPPFVLGRSQRPDKRPEDLLQCIRMDRGAPIRTIIKEEASVGYDVGSGLAKDKKQGVRKRPNPLILLMAVYLGLEPRTFGSGDQ